ncbi:MAG: SpoIIE family protein phosphatase [bacterium]|nr:SpoIIE family protein phosphatase [bacterium]
MKLYLSHAGENWSRDLQDGEYVVGRDRYADIRVSPADVSARHARLRIAGDRLFVSDLGSSNGTFIGGVAVDPDRSETEAPPGSTINLASLIVVWTVGDATRPPGSSHDLVASHTYFDDRQGLVGVSSARIGEMLSSLFDLIAMDGRGKDFEDEACGFVSRWIPCGRIALMLDDGPGTRHKVAGSWSADGEDLENVQLSATIMKKVCDERASLLLADPSLITESSSDSIIKARLTSAMAVPLFDNKRVRGILYVDTRDAAIQFERHDLEILTATANAVAIKLSYWEMEHELLVARRIQRRMCPSRIPDMPDYEVAARLVSCFAIGGDFYHVGEPQEGKVLIALGDVAGKGLPAALTMAACSVLLPALDGFCDCPCTLAERLHHSLEPKLALERFVTAFVGELNLATGRLRYVNAGHVQPMLVRADGTVEKLEPTGGPVGMFKEFSCSGEVTQLAPGDLLAVFSDGVEDATIHGDEFFGRDRAEAVILEHRGKDLTGIIDLLFEEITTFVQGGHTTDDTTLLLVRRRREWTEPS